VEKSGLAAAQLIKTKPLKPAPKVLVTAVKKTVDKPKVIVARPVTKPIRLAKVDPLAPLPARHSGHSKDINAD